MFGCEAAAKHMLLAKKCTKYVGDDQGILNLKLMQQLYHVVAYNLAKSRAARDRNKQLKRKKFRPAHIKLNGLVLVRDHTSKAFEPTGINHRVVDSDGKNRVIVKDCYGNIKKVHRRDVKPVEMDIATAEFFRRENEKSTIRDTQHVMPIKQIPDLGWKFNENIDQLETKPEMICTTEIVAKELQGKCLPRVPATTGSTLITAEQAIQATPPTPQTNSFNVAKIFAVLKKVADAVSHQITSQMHF